MPVERSDLCCYPDKVVLDSTIHAHDAAFARCFDTHDARAESVRVVANLAFTRRGVVARACASEPDAPASFLHCVADELRTIDLGFDPHSACPPIRVVYPLVFVR